VSEARFDWDPGKDEENQRKHGVAFAKAQLAFADPRRVIAEDLTHSSEEKRYYCFGVGRERDSDGSVYVLRRRHTNLRRRLLARREEAL
jgi:uncharacterized DUF497 family protein